MSKYITITAGDAALLSHALRETSGMRNELRWYSSEEHLIRPLLTSRPPELGVNPQEIWQEPGARVMEKDNVGHGCESNGNDEENVEDDQDDDHNDEDEEDDDSTYEDDGDVLIAGPSSSNTPPSRAFQPTSPATPSRRNGKPDPFKRRARLVAAYKEAAVGNESDPFSVLCMACQVTLNMLQTKATQPGYRSWKETRWRQHVASGKHLSFMEEWENQGCPGAKSD